MLRGDGEKAKPVMVTDAAWAVGVVLVVGGVVVVVLGVVTVVPGVVVVVLGVVVLLQPAKAAPPKSKTEKSVVSFFIYGGLKRLVSFMITPN